MNEVWVLEEIADYEGSRVIGVYASPDAAKEDEELPSNLDWRQDDRGDFIATHILEYTITRWVVLFGNLHSPTSETEES